ncbi:hypothetical protein BJX64DRAFT_266965 [Aspergillus heterothallicus]
MAEVSPPEYALISSPRARTRVAMSATTLVIAAASRSTREGSRATFVGVARTVDMAPRPARMADTLSFILTQVQH